MDNCSLNACISSVSNEKIKLARKIATSSKARKETGLFFLEGQRLCSDAALCDVKIRQFFYTASSREKSPESVALLLKRAQTSFEISDSVSERLSDTQSPQGMFCLCEMPDRSSMAILPHESYIVLEQIQDPANLGAIIRTAEALGIRGAVLFGCCDVYNPKAQRAAMGSLLRLELHCPDDLSAFLLACKENGMRLLATTPRSDAADIRTLDLCCGALAVIGNEGSGVSPQTAALCETVTIPMLGRAESLNASMAAAIVMWEMMRQKPLQG